MTNVDYLQLIIYLGIIILMVKPLGWYIAQIYSGTLYGKQLTNNFIEKLVYRMCDIEPSEEMDWRQYARSVLLFNFCSWLLIYIFFRLQYYLPLNPQQLPGVEPDLAFNAASSIASNTGWQSYAGENTLGYVPQILCLTAQGFLSGATGISVLMALIRGIARRETTKLGNFWVDNLRTIVYLLLPISIILSIVLVSQGVIQNLNPYQHIELIDPFTTTEAPTVEFTTQTLPMGPVASLVAIKQIGSSGAGFFNTNSAHPFANPNSVTNFLQMLGLILIPAALCYTYGYAIKQRAHGWMLLGAILLVFIPCTLLVIKAEHSGNPVISEAGVYLHGNYEGKELRFGIVDSAIWATTTAASANGSVNSMLDSFMPLSNFLILMLMHFGEVIFGGVGCGLYGLIFMDVVAVFIAGLMIGRTPEYMGKKITPFDMKMIAIVILVMPLIILFWSAYACTSPLGTASISNPGAHGFSEILYAYTSGFYNNGSAFAGLQADTPFYNTTIGITMLISRYWIVIAILAVAGSMARKRYIPAGTTTLRTHNVMFAILLICVIAFMGGLTFFPTLTLGPIVDLFTLWSKDVIL